MNHLTHIEPLEDRIAPALILNPYTVTFQDTDGDTAIVHISKPLFKNAAAAAQILDFTLNSGGQDTTFNSNAVGESLTTINLLGRTDATGMNISVKVIPQVGVGNGQVNVGNIAAATVSPSTLQVTNNISLGNIYIQGDLGAISAGASLYQFTPGVQSLTVLSMNEADQSYVLGPIGKLSVQGNFIGNLTMIGFRFGSIDNLYIGGSLTGDSLGDAGTGTIEFPGHIGTATIGNITGTSGSNTGELAGISGNPSQIGSLHVLGSITGGSGADSGDVFAQTSIGTLVVDGSIVGGSGSNSGEILGPLGKVMVQGNLTGGSGESSGSIFGLGTTSNGSETAVAIGTVTIGGNVTGGSAGTAASGTTTAAIPGDTGVISAASARSISIGGSLIGGTASGTSQTADTSGAILLNTAGSITIGNNIVGGSGPNSGVITIQSPLSKTNYSNIVVNGSVTGGAGATSGAILANGIFGGTITKLRIGENLAGGTGNNSGEVIAAGTLGSATIDGNLTGNTAIDSSTAVVGSGYIQAGHIVALDILGNVTSGMNSGGEIANSGAIRSTGDILSLNIQGQVTGNSSNPVIISAAQAPGVTARSRTDLAIKSVTIAQAASYLDILAGYGPTVSSGSDPAGAPLGNPVDGSAQIGTLTFDSTLSATNLVAGALPDPSTGQFGTANNSAITAQTGSIQSLIASIVVKGQATGDATLTDSFGFVAEKLQSVQIDGASVPTDTLVPGTPVAYDGTNLFLLEVKPPA